MKNPSKILKAANKSGIPIRSHNVIYKLVDDLKEEINTRLPTTEIEEMIGACHSGCFSGEANLLQEFKVSEKKKKKKVNVAGSRCTKGIMKKNEFCRVVRKNEVIYTGTFQSVCSSGSSFFICKTAISR